MNMSNLAMLGASGGSVKFFLIDSLNAMYTSECKKFQNVK